MKGLATYVSHDSELVLRPLVAALKPLEPFMDLVPPGERSGRYADTLKEDSKWLTRITAAEILWRLL